MRRRTVWMLPAVTTGALACGLVIAPAASAADTRAPIAPIAFLGLPSLHSIIEAIAKGFFGALAGALVPGWLKHGTVATIQHLVALPDPASWTHVGELQGDMTYLGVSLLPVTLAVATVRYWMMGLTGSAHPAGAIGRCVAATGVLVAYSWIVAEVVAGTNTLTHAILGFPVVADGLASIISVLFGGALLSGAGGVFGAFLVIIGVLFAAGLFALQVLLTLVLAMLIVAGPPLIALSAIPELSHLARAWAQALLAVALVPLGWTVLFATAGALSPGRDELHRWRRWAAGSCGGGVRGADHVRARGEAAADAARAAAPSVQRRGQQQRRRPRRRARCRAQSGSGRHTPGCVPWRSRVPRRSGAASGAPRARWAPREGGPVGGARRGLAGAARRAGVLPAYGGGRSRWPAQARCCHGRPPGCARAPAQRRGDPRERAARRAGGGSGQRP